MCRAKWYNMGEADETIGDSSVHGMRYGVGVGASRGVSASVWRFHIQLVANCREGYYCESSNRFVSASTASVAPCMSSASTCVSSASVSMTAIMSTRFLADFSKAASSSIDSL